MGKWDAKIWKRKNRPSRPVRAAGLSGRSGKCGTPLEAMAIVMMATFQLDNHVTVNFPCASMLKL